MNKLTTLFLTILLAVPSAGPVSFAQDYKQPPVTISKEKVRLNGKVYYSHVVLEKQTLFSVAKAYGVSMQDIIDANPALDLTNNGLKKNQIVLIPADLVNSAPAPAAEKEEAAQEETKAAPAARQSVKEEAPVETDDEQGTAAPKSGSKDYFIHIVKWYEGLSDVAKKYGMSEEAIMKYNGLTTPSVKKKMRLKIPYKPEEAESFKPEEKQPVTAEIEDRTPVAIPEETVATVEEAVDSVEVRERDIPWYKTIFTGKKDIDVSLLIPLNADGAVNTNFADFYAGALLAAKDLGSKDGINLDIDVYDTASGIIPLTEENYEKSDLVIGPVSMKDIETALEVCPGNRFIISPLDPGVSALAATTSNLIHAPTPVASQYKDVVEWVCKDKAAEEVVLLITEKEARESNVSAGIKAALDSTGIQYQVLQYGILEGRNIDRTMAGMLSKDATNRIILASESEAFVGDVVRNLNLLLHARYSVVLYSPSKIRTFDTIDVESLHKLNLHVSASYFIDYDDPRVKAFLMAYRALFKTEPSQFAFQGYDVMDYFVKMYSKYGRNWYKMATRGKSSGLQSDYRFTEYRDGGFVNGAVRRIVYDPGFTVTVVNNDKD